MRLCHLRLSIFFLMPMLVGHLASDAYGDDPGISENECVHLKTAEIVWDLSKYRWLCCIPKSADEYETCIPITDMHPLPKTSLKPLPPQTTKTIKP